MDGVKAELVARNEVELAFSAKAVPPILWIDSPTKGTAMSTDREEPNMAVKRVAFLIQGGADLLDIAGPAGVFHCAGRHFVRIGVADQVTYQLAYISPDGGMVRTRQELLIQTSPLAAAEPEDYDTIIVVGGLVDDRDCPAALIEWLKRCRGSVRRIASVCVGAFYLARAGLLDDRRATTHWEDCENLTERFPNVLLEPDAIYTEDRGIWTGAGVSAGIDLALAMVEQDHGHDLALLVARRQVVFLKRPGGQSQFSSFLECQRRERPLAPLLQWIVENPTADLRVEALADRANMSLRSLYRWFVAVAGSSPADWVENVRLEVAKRLLEQTTNRISQIARDSGFGSDERMRRTFARRLGIGPSDYRARFSRPVPRYENAVDLACLTDIYGSADRAIIH
ncbi:MAG TPA: helix-turn-helix domain-containing protein [Sphingomicrobium sp.]|nr:helix-turn-helix domain-containing protein [Sphingomicrobium sp.]